MSAYTKRKRTYRRRGGPPSTRTGPRYRTGGRYTPSAAMRVAMMTPLPRQRGYLRTGGFYGRYANGGELKFLDTQVDSAMAVTGTIVDTFVTIPQGVTESQRVGRKCTIKAINWRWRVRLPNTTTVGNTSDTARMIMYLDKQTNGSPATAILLLEAGAGSVGFQSYNNLENSGRFRILYDKVVDLVAKSGSGTGAAGVQFGEDNVYGSMYKKCNIPIEYDNSASTGVLTSMRSNNLGFLFLSSDGVATVISKVRLRFSDS